MSTNWYFRYLFLDVSGMSRLFPKIIILPVQRNDIDFLTLNLFLTNNFLSLKCFSSNKRQRPIGLVLRIIFWRISILIIGLCVCVYSGDSSGLKWSSCWVCVIDKHWRNLTNECPQNKKILPVCHSSVWSSHIWQAFGRILLNIL